VCLLHLRSSQTRMFPIGLLYNETSSRYALRLPQRRKQQLRQNSGSRTAFYSTGTNKAAEAQDHRSYPPTRFTMHRDTPSQSNTSSVRFAQFIWQTDNLAIYLYEYLTSSPNITQNIFSWSQQLNVQTVISLVQLYKI
jgi:hypothetical protein